VLGCAGDRADVAEDRLVGRRSDWLVRLHRPAKTFSEQPKLRHVVIAQVGVPLGKVLHRVVEPILLVLWSCFENAASEDVGEELIAGLFEGGWSVFSKLSFLFRHALTPFGSG